MAEPMIEQRIMSGGPSRRPLGDGMGGIPEPEGLAGLAGGKDMLEKIRLDAIASHFMPSGEMDVEKIGQFVSSFKVEFLFNSIKPSLSKAFRPVSIAQSKRIFTLVEHFIRHKRILGSSEIADGEHAKGRACDAVDE